MNNEIILIDYENSSAIPAFKAQDICKIIIIVGSNQNKIPFETVQKLQKLGDKVEWIQLNETGKNALDFFITYYLGLYIARHPGKVFKIYTKDKGFDPLINHLKKDKIEITRHPE